MQITRTTNKIKKFESINFIDTENFIKDMKGNEFKNTLAFGTYDDKNCKTSIFFFELEGNSSLENGNIKTYIKKDSDLSRYLTRHFDKTFDEVEIDGVEYIEGVNFVGVTRKSFKAEKADFFCDDVTEDFYDIRNAIINNEKIKYENGYTIYFPASSEGTKEALFENDIKFNQYKGKRININQYKGKHINIFSEKNNKLSYHEWWNAFVDFSNKVVNN